MELLTPGQLKKLKKRKELEAYVDTEDEETYPPKATKLLSQKVLQQLTSIEERGGSFPALLETANYDEFMTTLFEGQLLSIT